MKVGPVLGTLMEQSPGFSRKIDRVTFRVTQGLKIRESKQPCGLSAAV
jgi:hypothetical protein